MGMLELGREGTVGDVGAGAVIPIALVATLLALLIDLPIVPLTVLNALLRLPESAPSPFYLEPQVSMAEEKPRGTRPRPIF